MVTEEIKKLKTILDLMLGESKQELDNSMQLEYPCPCCIDKYGSQEIRKYNLSISLSKQKMQCWRCSSEGDNGLHGSIIKLIKMYGNDKLLSEYKEIIRSIRDSELYKLNFSNDDFNIDTSVIEKEELKFPQSFKRFDEHGYNDRRALQYLMDRGIGWDIINEYKLGYTTFQEENKKGSFRIIIPSYNTLGELNYWVGRDYLPNDEKSPYKRLKYDNPKVEKKSIIFNEEKIQWDADITLVEGTFDHIVVPNSIPLLGKTLDRDYKLYWELTTKFNGSAINIMLDGDAYESALEVYKLLNHGRLYNNVRLIPMEEKEDPSSIYQKYGRKGIMGHIANSVKISEVYLQ